ncbi:hypothetical protein CVS40_7511, partial [Lucilia cuprina]
LKFTHKYKLNKKRVSLVLDFLLFFIFLVFVFQALF